MGCKMIQICHGCQSLQKIPCLKKNDGVTSLTLAVSRYSRWRPRWPKSHTCSFFSGTIGHREVILVSNLWFSGSANPNNIFNSRPNDHVTLYAKVTPLNCQSSICRKLKVIPTYLWCLEYGFRGQRIQITYSIHGPMITWPCTPRSRP